MRKVSSLFLALTLILILSTSFPAVRAKVQTESSSLTVETCGDTSTDYLDIKRAHLSQSGEGSIRMKMRLCGPIPLTPPLDTCTGWFWLFDIDLNATTGFSINDIGADKAVGVVGNGGTCGTAFPLGVYSAWLFDIPPEIVVPTGEPFTITNVGGRGMVTAMESLSDLMLTKHSTFHSVALTMAAVNVFADVAPNEGHVTHSL